MQVQSAPTRKTTVAGGAAAHIARGLVLRGAIGAFVNFLASAGTRVLITILADSNQRARPKLYPARGPTFRNSTWDVDPRSPPVGNFD